MDIKKLGLSPEELAFEESIKDLPLDARVRKRSILTRANIASALAIFNQHADEKHEKSGIKPSTLDQAVTVELDPRLKTYKEHYDKWDQFSKSKISWQIVQQRFLANNCFYLNKAEALDRPLLFGADLAGNPLLANAETGPINVGINYEESRKIVFEDAYELFGYIEPYSKSREILLFEEFTGHPIVKDGSIWLESSTIKNVSVNNSKHPNRPRVASCYGKDKESSISTVNPAQVSSSRGVRVFLRMLP